MSNSDDARILGIYRELCQQLNIRSSFAKEVEWEDIIPAGRWTIMIHSDECRVYHRELILPERMKGRLEPDEWRPLLASDLVYTFKLQRVILSYFLKRRVLPGIVLLALVWSYYLLAFPSAQEDLSLLTFPMVMTFLAAAAVSSKTSPGFLRKTHLKADRMAAELVGKDSLLRVLLKIDSMGLKDIEKLKKSGLRARFSKRPSITRRIENLLAVR